MKRVLTAVSLFLFLTVSSGGQAILPVEPGQAGLPVLHTQRLAALGKVGARQARAPVHVPHVPVPRTIAGVAAGRDEVLEKAVEIARQ